MRWCDLVALVETLAPVILVVNLSLHCMVLGFIVVQLRWPYPFARWTRAWLALLLTWTCILVFRLADFYAPPTYWRMLLACPMTLGLWYGMAQLAWIFHEGQLDPPPPDGPDTPGAGDDTRH